MTVNQRISVREYGVGRVEYLVETFVWDQNFVTGLVLVDEQHHELVNLFNEFSNSLFLSHSSQSTLLADTFARVLDYTQYHFQDEESLMLAEGVDSRHIDSHQAMHKQFVAQVRLMWDRRSVTSDTGAGLIGFLTSWLSLHILGTDKLLAHQIQLIHDGIPAASAFERATSTQDNGMHAVLKLVGNLYRVLSLQNTELAHTNEKLEERVAERTRELEGANRQLNEAYAKLEAYSRMDGLLQIANRQHFDMSLRNAYASAFRRKQSLGLLMIDVDFFKRYNDSYGHQAGDACLKAVAGAVQGALERTTDLLARYGGEELAVILPDTDDAGVIRVAERVVVAVLALGLAHKASDVASVVTVSAGAVSRVPMTGDTAQLLLADADDALYAAKNSGRNRSVTYR